MNWMNFDGRDGVMLLIALAAAYLLVTTLRLSRVGRVKKPAPRPAPPEKVENTEKTEHAGGSPLRFLSLKNWFSRAPHRSPPSRAPAPVAHQERRDPSLTPTFDEHLFRHNVENELQQLRAEVAELREAFGRLQTSRNVSPQYTEAMRLAQRGATARIIADECAISIGEAELVRALSKNSQEIPDDDGPYDEDHWER